MSTLFLAIHGALLPVGQDAFVVVLQDEHEHKATAMDKHVAEFMRNSEYPSVLSYQREVFRAKLYFKTKHGADEALAKIKNAMIEGHAIVELDTSISWEELAGDAIEACIEQFENSHH